MNAAHRHHRDYCVVTDDELDDDLLPWIRVDSHGDDSYRVFLCAPRNGRPKPLFDNMGFVMDELRMRRGRKVEINPAFRQTQKWVSNAFIAKRWPEVSLKRLEDDVFLGNSDDDLEEV